MLPHNASAETTSSWLAFNRYGQHVRTLNNFDARDLLRLGKDDLQQMIGVVDGVRLFNDLHMKPVSPRLTFILLKRVNLSSIPSSFKMSQCQNLEEIFPKLLR